MSLAFGAPERTLLEYLFECGLSGKFLAVAVLTYFGILWAAVGNPRVFHRLLIPTSTLPFVIGIFGTACFFHSALWSMRNPPNSGIACGWFIPWEEGLVPLIAGSFMTMLFIVISLVFQFIHRRLLAGLNDGS